jgi:hypothetical protein
MKITFVTTTINIPTLLEGYCEDIASIESDCEIDFIVIGDKKTPADVRDFCIRLEHRFGLPIQYYDIDDQMKYLRQFPELGQYLPFNSVQRRNIGFVKAYEQGSDIIISFDDDNYRYQQSILEGHLSIGQIETMEIVHSPTGWFDPCIFLREKRGIPFCHRGFPRSERWNYGEVRWTVESVKVVVNVGLWVGDPDVDAWMRMALPLETVAWERERNFALGPGTWAPFNSQQTALLREVLPAYFLNPYAGRYDDIWASYIVHKISNHLGNYVSYGKPIVLHKQERSLESLWRDIDDERMGSILNERFIRVLRETSLTGSTYRECYVEIGESLERWAVDGTDLSLEERQYILEYVRGMRVWQKTFDSLIGYS